MKVARIIGYFLRGAVWLGVMTTIVRSGITPGPRDSKKWYDRTIRIVGGLIIGIMSLLGLALTLTHLEQFIR